MLKYPVNFLLLCLSGLLMLQAAVGTADFRGVAFEEEKVATVRAGMKNYHLQTFFKVDNIQISHEGLQQCPFARETGRTRMELSWRDPHLPGFLRFQSSRLPAVIYCSFWDDSLGEFSEAQPVHPEACAGSWEILFPDFPATRKVLLDFGKEPLEMGSVDFSVFEFASEDWQANWIWYTADRIENVRCYLRCEFELSEVPAQALLQYTADDRGHFLINGKSIEAASDWRQAGCRDLAGLLRPGRNVLAAEVSQLRYSAGLLAELDLLFADGRERKIVSDRSWLCSLEEKEGWALSEFQAEGWRPAVELGRPPDGAWGKIPYHLNGKRLPVQLTGEVLPAVLEAGQTYQAGFQLQLPEPALENFPLTLVLSRAGEDFERLYLGCLRTGEQRGAFVINWMVNPFLQAGTYQLKLELSKCEVQIEKRSFAREVTLQNSRRPEPARAQIRNRNGIPLLHVNDQPIYSSMITLKGGCDQRAMFQNAARGGFKLLYLYAKVEDAGDGNYNYANLDQIAASVLRDNPDAYMVVRIDARNLLTSEFIQRYPAELVRFDDGRQRDSASLGSEVWNQVKEKFFAAIVRHIQSSPYADRLIGIFPADGEEGQWMHYWDGDDPNVPGSLTDYSPAMLQYFRRWLQKKYGSDAALQASWGDAAVRLESVQIPAREVRVGNDGIFRRLPEERAAVDYAEALSDAVADGIIRLAKVIKESSGGRMITGVLYGHLIDLGAHFLGEQTGYLKMRRVIDCPWLDYLSGPLHYGKDNRDIGGVSSFDYPAPGTLRLQNKIWLNEDDLRTHLTNPPDYAYSVRTASQTDQVLARAMAKALGGGAGFYYCNLSGGNRNFYDDPESLQTMSELEKISASAPRRALSSSAEVAVVLSDVSLAYLRQLKSRSPEDALMGQAIANRVEISRMGAPFDEYLISDFLNQQLPGHKLYIFLNAYFLESGLREAIRAHLERHQATAIWLHAPGIFDENGLNAGKSGLLTGISVRLSEERHNGLATLTQAWIGLPAGTVFGPPGGISFSPFYLPDDPLQQVIAVRTVDQQPSLVRKGRHYLSILPGLRAEMYREIAREAGVFIYSEDLDAVYTNAGFLSVHTSKEAGSRCLRLPPGKVARQLWPVEGEKVFQEQIRFDSPTPQTRIYEWVEK